MKRALPALLVALASCWDPNGGLDLARMIDQPRVDPYQESRVFEDGMGMRTPPRGTVPVERQAQPPQIEEGLVSGTPVDRIPVPVTRELVERGRERFQVYCATCHGHVGDGNSVVASNMQLRRPPSLLADPIRTYPPGRIYHVVRRGYGMMPGYELQLSTQDRWAVTAYVQALQLSQYAPLERLPPAVRERARREAGEGR